MYKIQCRENGDVIEVFRWKDDAEYELKKYEESDKKDNIYEPDFYEIVECKLDQKKMYNENDISIMLDEVQENEQTKNKFSKLIEKYATGRDKGALLNALNNFVGGEQFTRYDSDVCEQFIRLYERFRGWK